MSGSTEFLDGRHGAVADDDVLEVGPRRSLPRWLIALVVVLIAAGVTVAVGLRDGSARRSASAVTSSPNNLARAPLGAGPGVGSPLDLGSGAPVLDVSMSLDSVWVLQRDRLTGNGLIGENRHADLDLQVAPATSARLVVDVPAARLWVVLEGAAATRVLEFDAFTLRQLGDVRSSLPIDGAAALAGRLYLTSAHRVLGLRGGRLSPLVDLRTSLREIVADPARSRLLVVDDGPASYLWAYFPTARTAQRGARLPVRGASVAIVRGSIWVAGQQRSGPRLFRLDADNLRPGSATYSEGVGGVIVASGSDVFWMRDVTRRGQLRCVDAASGQGVQSWRVDGNVTSTRHGALVASPAGAAPLVLNGCAG